MNGKLKIKPVTIPVEVWDAPGFKVIPRIVRRKARARANYLKACAYRQAQKIYVTLAR